MKYAFALLFLFTCQAQALSFFPEKIDPKTAKWSELLYKVLQTGYPIQAQFENAKFIVDSVPNNPRKNRVEYFIKVGVKGKKAYGRVITSGFVEVRKSTFTRHEIYTDTWAVEAIYFQLNPKGDLISAERKSMIIEELRKGGVEVLGEKTTLINKVEAEKEWQATRDYWMSPSRTIFEPRQYDPNRHILLDEA